MIDADIMAVDTLRTLAPVSHKLYAASSDES
jgi:hypothetical protein